MTEKKEEYNIKLIEDTKSVLNQFTEVKSTSEYLGVDDGFSVSGILIKVNEVIVFIRDAQVEEVFSKNKMSYEEVPKDVPALIGAINYRGNVLSVINLNEILFPQSSSVNPQHNSESQQVIIVHDQGQRFALTCDEVQKWIKIKPTDIRKISFLKGTKKADYIFTGAFIGENNNIVFVLNTSWIIDNHQNPDILRSSYQKFVYFDNPIIHTLETDYMVEFDGLLLRSGDHFFVLDTRIIKTIRNEEEELYVPKSFMNKSIVGLGIHNQIHPVIDFHSFFYQQDLQDSGNYNKVVITVEDPKTKQELSLLVEEILAKVTSKDLTVLQKGISLSKEICDDIYQGFFAFSSILGGILDSTVMLDKLKEVLKQEFGKLPTLEELEELVSIDEKEGLYDYRDKQKEIEFMLFDDTGKERIQYLVFTLNEIRFGIDPSLIVSVIDTDKISKINEENNPVLGTLSYDDQIIPIVDVVNLLFPNGELETKIDENLFLLLKGDASENIYALPTINIDGVLTTYVEDLTHVEINEAFNDKYNICQNHFIDDKFDTPIYGMDNSFIQHFNKNQTIIEQIEKFNVK